ncbi:RNA pseudouridine synthase [Candidatus Aerophobetes bacterium]|uniref:RNA pseudouridine synthase n=1 Tax=Aerophobetes bacterium TaxID=2030807 RepID=A0A2A4X2U6_UNCAE|nr:MAG: RNA pseudouridine synthase [Candidatus Aerophobetes bacterium]
MEGMNYQEIKITSDICLIDAMSNAFPDSSKSTLKKWIVHRRVILKGKPVVKTNDPLKEGDTLRFYEKKRIGAKKLAILYSDNHIIVVDKPCSLLSVATYYEQDDTVHDILKQSKTHARVFPVHRLDRETSGVMVFATTNIAREALTEQFHRHSIEREYHAIVEGVAQDEQGTWAHKLLEDANYMMKPNTRGVMSVTHFNRALVSKKYSYLICHLETGKKNQIRVGASLAGHPIVGDVKYGAAPSPIGRLGLHAHSLGFQHPMTGKYMFFNSIVPPLFMRLFPAEKDFFMNLNSRDACEKVIS